MSVINLWVGATTPSSARVVMKVDNGPVELLVADNPGMVNPLTFGPEAVDADGVASVSATGLDPDTQYWYQVADNSVLDEDVTGRFRTHPPLGSVASFEIVVGSCAGPDSDYPGEGAVLASDRVCNHPVFDTVRQRDPLMMVHLGDRQYYDLGSGLHGIAGGGSLANYRRAYDDVLLQSRQHQLYREISTAYIYDDHDWGPNDSDGTLPDRANALEAYRGKVPHYPLPAGSGDNPVYQSWQIGRVLFILSDVRADRSPNADVDSPSKTMLGSSQKAWMGSVLESSDAEAFIWLMPDQWLNPGTTDAWGGYTFERDELTAMLDDTGWLGRMGMVYGDRHALGLDTGGGNPWGGFPVLQAASLDSTPPSAPVTTRFDTGPDLPGRNQYGTVTVNDLGSEIRITFAGWVGTSLWKSFTFTVTVDDPPPPPPPPPPPVARAEIRTRVTWLGCRLTDGRIIAELPDITGRVSRVIGDVTTTGLSLPIPLSGPAALPIGLVEQATEPGNAMIVAVVNDIPTWGGIVVATEGGTGSTMSVSVASLEAYLGRRIVRDHTFNQVDEALIAATLVGDAGDIPGVGFGIGLDIDAPDTGTLRDRSYLLTDRKTVLEALQELMEIIDGPEWTIDLDWTDETRSAIAKIFRVRKRIGVASATPEVFETTANSVFGSQEGSEAWYSYEVDYSDGRGGNYVVAYSSGQGEDQPFSTPEVDEELLATGFPIYEHHFQPSSNITSPEVLTEHALAELSRRGRGTRTFVLESRWDAYPRYGVDWEIGDDVAWKLVGHRHPQGIQGQGRAIGIELDLQQRMIKPILEED